MQPEQIVEALNGMGKTPEGQKQVQAYMQQFQQELQGQQAGMFKDGGKLHNFICKHAKGGVAGCGCHDEGGRMEGIQAIHPGFSRTGEYVIRDRHEPNIWHVQTEGYNINGQDVGVLTREGAHRSGGVPGAAYENGEIVYQPGA